MIIPNWSIDTTYPWNSTIVYRVGNATDGVLSEAGFSNYGCADGCTTGASWVNKQHFLRNLQAGGVAFYAINEIGDVRNPANWPLPCSADPKNCITAAKRQYVLASLLMSKVTLSPLGAPPPPRRRRAATDPGDVGRRSTPRRRTFPGFSSACPLFLPH